MSTTNGTSPSGAGWWPSPADRIIEVQPPDAGRFEALALRGCHRYLALVADAGSAAALVAQGVPTERVTVMESLDDARRNNADVIILHGPHLRLLWYRQLGLAHHIVVPADGPGVAEALLASRLHRREVADGDWDGRPHHVLSSRVVHGTGARHHLSPVIGLEGLPSRLDEAGVDYAVLRWFDLLPGREPGEDLDVLVRDAHHGTLIGILGEEPGTVPVDVYTETGLPGSDFRAMAYYPPRLSSGLLDRAVRLSSGYRAPAPADHFHSLAYHAIYHKGAACGLPTGLELADDGEEPEHDYARVLDGLARATGLTGPLTMERLDEHLDEVGWRPPRDMLAKLAPENPWVASRFFGDDRSRPEPPLLTVFVMRERAADADSLALTRAALVEHGFEIVGVHELDEAAVRRCTTEIRGGNWGQGPYPLSGGGPTAIVVALDTRPRHPSPDQQRQHPDLANARTLEAKLDVRDRLLAAVPADRQFNPMHSSDSDADAWHYLELAAPDEVDGVRAVVEARRPESGWDGAGSGPAAAVASGLATTKRRTRRILGAVRRQARRRAAEAARAAVARRTAAAERVGP